VPVLVERGFKITELPTHADSKTNTPGKVWT
jgi:hypothetical protein